jgi:transglutaminase/protease-like cytokinesis protein 3
MKNKTLRLLLLLFLVNVTAFSQKYAAIDNQLQAWPKSFSSPQKLADKVNTDFKTDEDKVRAIFTWIALNVQYDLKAYKSGASMIAYSYSSEADRIAKEQKYRLEYAEKTLRSKKGVCQDYSALFHTVCELSGIKCIAIIGTSKAHPSQIGKLPKASDHEWNAVKINDKWQLIDVTWAAGSVSMETGKFQSEFNDGYFFTNPELFYLNHFPDDKRLLMTNKTPQDFAELPLYYGPYVQANYEFASPEKGLISVASESVLFQIIDLPQNSRISYVFTNEGKIRDIEPRQNGNATEFIIPLSARSRGYLTVYINNAAITSYKIER